jgi:hypothetical protein
MTLVSLMLAFAPALAARARPEPQPQKDPKVAELKAELEATKLHLAAVRAQRDALRHGDELVAMRAERDEARRERDRIRRALNVGIGLGQQAQQAQQPQYPMQQAAAMQQYQAAMQQNAQLAGMEGLGQWGQMDPGHMHASCTPSRSALITGRALPGPPAAE